MSEELQSTITTKAKFLCNLCDCVSIGNKGDELVHTIFQQYPYSNCYSGRLATKKSQPGTLQIKGDGKKNRYVVNLFVQFYPGPPKYPNDNIIKRLEWFGTCLDKLLEIPDAESLSFPAELGLYSDFDYTQRYQNLIDDFRRKYLLRQQKCINIVDYFNNNYVFGGNTSQTVIKYEKPIEKINTHNWIDINEIDILNDTFSASNEIDESIEICVLRKIDLSSLKYLAINNSNHNQNCDSSNSMQSKIKLDFKKTETIFESMPQKEVQIATTVQKKPLVMKRSPPLKTIQQESKTVIDPTIVGSINDSVSVTQPQKNILTNDIENKGGITQKKSLKKNFLADDTDEEKIKIPKKTALKKNNPDLHNLTIEPIIQSSKSYDKNPSWKKSISELAAEINDSWDPIFKHPTIMAILSQLDQDFDKELDAFGDHIEILPSPQELIFESFNQCEYPPKAVILGQDPYFSNLNEAMGLSFSVPTGVKKPPTLDNIFKELSTDIEGFKVPISGDLTQWAQQRVLLLNTALTVRYKQKESHLKLWKTFTDKVIELLSQNLDSPIVFMLWGNPAKLRKKLIKNVDKHLILEATHPSPLGANQGGFFDCKHFSKTNQFLAKNKIPTINWNLN